VVSLKNMLNYNDFLNPKSPIRNPKSKGPQSAGDSYSFSIPHFMKIYIFSYFDYEDENDDEDDCNNPVHRIRSIG
jgi:hypothetical protein